MAYQAPIRTKLNEFIKDPNYNKTDNANRLIALQLLKEFNAILMEPASTPVGVVAIDIENGPTFYSNNKQQEQEELDALISMMLLAYDTTKNMTESEWCPSWFKYNNSALRSGIFKALDLGKMDERTRYYYLGKAYSYLNKYPQKAEKLVQKLNTFCESDLTRLGFKKQKSLWPTVNDLKAALATAMKDILAKTENRSFLDLLKGPPALRSLKDKITTAINNYRNLFKSEKAKAVGQQLTQDEIAGRIKTTSRRELAVSFLEFANSTCDKFYAQPASLDNLNDDALHNLEICYNIRMGAILDVMMAIEAEYAAYKWVCWPPDKSKLYQYCKEALGINSSADLDVELKNEYLGAIYTYLHHAPKNIKHEYERYGTTEKTFRHVQENIHKIRNEVVSFIQPEGDIPCNVAGTVGSHAKYYTEFVFNSGVASLVNLAIPVPEMGKTAVKLLSGAIGAAIFGPVGGFVFSYASQLFTERVLPGYIAWPAISMFKPLGTALGTGVGGAATLLIYPLEKGFKFVIHSSQKITQEQMDAILTDMQFIAAMLNSPPEVISMDKKEKLKEMMPRNNGENYQIPQMTSLRA